MPLASPITACAWVIFGKYPTRIVELLTFLEQALPIIIKKNRKHRTTQYFKIFTLSIVTLSKIYNLYQSGRDLSKIYYIEYVKIAFSFFSNDSFTRLHISAKVIVSSTSVIAFLTSIITPRITHVTSSVHGL